MGLSTGRANAEEGGMSDSPDAAITRAGWSMWLLWGGAGPDSGAAEESYILKKNNG